MVGDEDPFEGMANVVLQAKLPATVLFLEEKLDFLEQVTITVRAEVREVRFNMDPDAVRVHILRPLSAKLGEA